MDSSKLSALFLILLLSVSSSPLTLACLYCPPRTGTPPAPKTKTPSAPRTPPAPKTKTPSAPKTPSTPKTPAPKGPITLPPIRLPPIIGKPPITLPPIIGKPPIPLPPVTLPPISLPPIVGTPPATTVRPPPPPPPARCGQAPATEFCPVDALKLGVCVDVLGAEWHLGDPTVTCCPLISGLTGLQAAVCLCTTIKAKLLNINVVFTLALELLITCGNAAPAGYTCPP